MSERSGASLMQRTSTRVLALLAAIAVVAVGVIWGAAPASAAVNPNISFSNIRIQKLDASGEPVLPTDTTQLTVQDTARLSFSWALAKGSPLAEGDSFSVTLPPQLKAAITSAGGLGTVPLQVDHQPKDGTPDTTIASCLVTEFKVECTFNAKAQELVTGGWDNITGNATVKLSAAEATTSDTLPFEFSGTPGVVQADLPGVGGIKAKILNPFTFTPSQFAKGSTGIGSGSTTVDYNVPLGFGAHGKSLGQHLKNANDTRVFDGVQVHTVTFTDTLGSGQRFFGPANWRLNLEATRADGPRKAVLDTGAPGATVNPDFGTFEIKVEADQATADGQMASISITGPFSADANYSLTYSACALEAPTCDVPDRKTLPKLKPGFNYDNNIVADGTQGTANLTRSFTAAFTSDVTMSLNYGTFSITKFVAGPGSALVQEGAPFTVNATYTLPAPADTTYPNWTAPGTLNADQLTGTLTMEAQVAKKVTFYGPSAPVTFPAGTRIVLSEQVNPAAAPDGYRWDGFGFEVGGKRTNELTIVSEAIVPVKLTNRLASLPKFPIAVKKALVGTPAEAQNHDFTFDYRCSDGQTGSLTANGNGTPAESTARFLPGTTCTVTENAADAIFAGYTLTPPAPAQVEVVAGDPVPVVMTNTYVQDMGTFKVKKTATGLPQGVAEAKDFVFDYDCGGTTGSVTVKGDGVAVAVNREFPSLSSCTVTENAASAAVPGYSLVAPPAQTVEIVADTEMEAVFTNAYSRDAGSFEVSKAVAGDGADLAAGKQFNFAYTCTDAAGAQTQGNFTLAAGATHVVNDVAAGRCSLTETGGDVANTDLATSFDVGGTKTDAATVEFAVAKGAKTTVAATNTYTAHVGTFSVAKTVTGVEPADKDFTFDYVCGAERGTITTKGNGVAVAAGKNFRVGTSCRVTENAQGAIIGGYNLSVPAPQTVTIAKDTTVAVSFTNAYSRKVGTFSVVKNVAGAPASAATKDFTFNYTCGAETGTVVAKGDGVAVAVGKNFPVGTSCTIGEDATTANIAGYTLTAPEAQTIQIAEGATGTEVTFVNTYSRDMGGFTLTKRVAGTGADMVAGKEFAFTYACRGLDGTEIQRDVTVTAGTPLVVTDVPVGACAIAEADAGIANADLVVSSTVDGTAVTTEFIGVPVLKGQNAAVEVTNTYTKHLGTFSVVKNVTGAPASAATKDFTFNYTCGAETGTVVAKGDGVAVPVGKNFPVGTSCTVTEDSDKAAIVGYTLTAPEAQTIEVAKDANTEVTFANAYSRDLGGFTVSKAVAGTGADLAKDKSFNFSYVCTGIDGTEEKADFALTPGSMMRVTDVPVGKCTLTEADAAIANTDLATAFSVDGTATDGNKVEFDVAKGAKLEVTATNTYTAHMSTFSVAKTVAGAPADAAGKEFKFNWTCGTESGTVVAKGDGVAVPVGKDFRVGTSCTVSEDTASAQIAGFNLAKPADQSVVLPAKGEVAAVAFENTYTKVIVPTPAPSATPSTPTPGKGKGGKLAKTGSDAIVVGSAALALLAGGALLIGMRRRKG
ncbi:DUF5979 domain-containing protein [Buchananella felis]|uniref:DUF5979 domain-containing protein n=1 Tax=Buchananella felis TaxID=3231492 RepID=UPI003528B81D